MCNFYSCEMGKGPMGSTEPQFSTLNYFSFELTNLKTVKQS